MNYSPCYSHTWVRQRLRYRFVTHYHPSCTTRFFFLTSYWCLHSHYDCPLGCRWVRVARLHQTTKLVRYLMYWALCNKLRPIMRWRTCVNPMNTLLHSNNSTTKIKNNNSNSSKRRKKVLEKEEMLHTKRLVLHRLNKLHTSTIYVTYRPKWHKSTRIFCKDLRKSKVCFECTWWVSVSIRPVVVSFHPITC